MTNIISRRRLLSLSAVGIVGALAACKTSTSGGVTNVTLDVTRIVTDGKAILASLSAALLAPSIAVLLGPNYAAAQAALAAAQLALTEIESLTGGTISVTLDTTKVQALVTSLLGDAQTALSLLQSIVGKLTGTVATAVGNYVAASLALIPFVQMAAGFTSAHPGAVGMTEAEALAVAGKAR